MTGATAPASLLPEKAARRFSVAKAAADPTDLRHVHGVDEPLPADEAILWQVGPDWRQVAFRSLALKPILLWLGALGIVRLGYLMLDGAHVQTMAAAVAWLVVCALAVSALLGLYAWGVGKTTRYYLTNRRIIIRCGVALDKTINVPLSKVESAGIQETGNNQGNIALTLEPDSKIGYLVLWPHVRAARGARAEPVLLAVSGVDRLARTLTDAWMSEQNRLAEERSGQQTDRQPDTDAVA